MICDIVLGTTFGDEGKGKVVYSLLESENYDLCVRFNGSGNAGHTIYHQNKKFVLHQLPIGVMKENVHNLISSDCLVDIEKLKNEIENLEKENIHIKNRLFISKAAHIITQECIDYDRANNKIGTTGSGIGPTYSLKMLRTGKRVEDYKEELETLGIQIVDMRKFWFTNNLNISTNYKKVLLEGAQGFELDINWTNHYPYCTSSTCTLAGAINTGIQLKNIRNIYGVAKAYDTYVGTMEFQPRDDEALEKIGTIGKEFGATTGRKRQCNYLNMDNLIEALYINNCNICIINKYDVLVEAQVFKLYYQNNLYSFENWNDMRDFIQNVLSKYKLIFSASPYTILDERENKKEEIKEVKKEIFFDYSNGRGILYSA